MRYFVWGQGVVARWRQRRILEDPSFARVLLNDSRFALLWLPLRFWLASIWLQGAFTKLTDPEWLGSGETMRQFLVNAAGQAGEPWYRSFLQLTLESGAYVWLAKLIAFGELAVGIGLVLGALTGLAAFFGALMNFNFLLAASAGPDPVMFVAAVALILAWKTAGYWGLDYFVLPLLGASNQPHPEAESEARRRRSEARRRLAARAVSVFSAGALLLLFASLAGVGSHPIQGAVLEGPVTILMGGADFQPGTVTIRAGSSVTWRNGSRVPHTVTSGSPPRASGRFDSAAVPASQEFSYTFTAAGDFDYFCAFHPGMTGKVRVLPTAS